MFTNIEKCILTFDRQRGLELMVSIERHDFRDACEIYPEIKERFWKEIRKGEKGLPYDLKNIFKALVLVKEQLALIEKVEKKIPTDLPTLDKEYKEALQAGYTTRAKILERKLNEILVKKFWGIGENRQ